VFILGVVALNLTDGLWAVVPIIDAAAVLASLSIGAFLKLRPTSLEIGRGVLAGSFAAFGLELVASAVLLFGWVVPTARDQVAARAGRDVCAADERARLRPRR
jgi:hypothetical protein